MTWRKGCAKDALGGQDRVSEAARLRTVTSRHCSTGPGAQDVVKIGS